jgi:hypothetical protein
LPALTGDDPAAVDPVLVQLIRNLTPGQAPVLRIGGDSTDQTWWPTPGVVAPILPVANYALTPGWFQTTAALARALNARLILGINLAIDQPALAAAEAQAMLTQIGRRSIAAFEIGNEPDLYGSYPEYMSPGGLLVPVRGEGYDFGDFMEQFAAVDQALPHLPIAGPALARGSRWVVDLPQFVVAEPGLRMITLHLYSLTRCDTPPSSPLYPTIAHLLSDSTTTALTRSVASSVALADASHLELRVDELNSVTCGGTAGVSNTFASALWALNALFALDQAGVTGVNIHMFAGAQYAPFSVAEADGVWSASVAPEYYGLLMFAQATPTGSRIMPSVSLRRARVKVWATITPDKTIRVVLINESASSRNVVLKAPHGAAGRATAERLLAPSLSATNGVTLRGLTFGASTDTGILSGVSHVARISPVKGLYRIGLPAASATMLTWRHRRSRRARRISR